MYDSKGTLTFTVLIISFSCIECVRDIQFKEKNLQETMIKMNTGPSGTDLEWVGSVNKWYMPFMSKQHLLRFSSALIERNNLKLNYLQEQSCLDFTPGNGFVNGFNGRSKDFQVEYIDGGIRFILPWKNIKGRFNFRITDNTSYILGIVTWQDGSITWVTLTPQPSLGPFEQAMILEYIESLDMDSNNEIVVSFENCI